MARGDIAYVLKRRGDDKPLFAQFHVFGGPLAFTNENVGWAHICSCGTWDGHPSGRTEFTREVFDSLIANSLDRETPIDFDYEHDTCNPYVTGPRPSAGFVKQLERRGDELWALVAWTQEAADYIRSGAYRSCSVVIDFEARDRVSNEEIGPELISVALTNNPFVDGLQTLQLKRFSAMTPEEEDKKKAEEEAAQKAAAAQAQQATPAADTPAAASGGAPATATQAANDAQPGAEQNAATIAVTALADATGMSADAVCAGLTENIDQVSAILRGAAAQDGTPAEATATAATNAMAVQLRATQRQLKAMSDRVSELVDQNAKREAAEKAALEAEQKSAAERAEAEKHAAICSRVDGLIKDKFIPKDDAQAREDAIAFFKSNPEAAERLYSVPKIPRGTVAGADPKVASTSVLTLDNCTEPEKRVFKKLLDVGVTEANAFKRLSADRAEGRVVI